MTVGVGLDFAFDVSLVIPVKDLFMSVLVAVLLAALAVLFLALLLQYLLLALLCQILCVLTCFILIVEVSWLRTLELSVSVRNAFRVLPPCWAVPSCMVVVVLLVLVLVLLLLWLVFEALDNSLNKRPCC